MGDMVSTTFSLYLFFNIFILFFTFVHNLAWFCDQFCKVAKARDRAPANCAKQICFKYIQNRLQICRNFTEQSWKSHFAI
jgi:hypothetical protein